MHMFYESLVGQCEYTTQPISSFWCHVIDTKSAIFLVMLLNKFVLVLFHSHLGMLELKLYRTSRVKQPGLRYKQFHNLDLNKFLG